MTFSTVLTPRFYETDALGHINNAAIAAWFEVVRIQWLESRTGAPVGIDRNWVLASLKLDFITETFYGTDVEARVIGAKVGNSSLTVHCEMLQDDRLTVRGIAVLVHVDLDAKRSLPIPDALRASLADVPAPPEDRR